MVNRGWVAAEYVLSGDKLMSLDGNLVVVEFVSIESLEKAVRVYNFEVEDLHTYYVGSTSILVHNSCAQKIVDPPTNPKLLKDSYLKQLEIDAHSLKEEVLKSVGKGNTPVSRFNIYQDTANDARLWLGRQSSGKWEWIDTLINLP